LVLISYMFKANCMGATSVSCLYGDLWQPVSQRKVLSSSVIYLVCYAENKQMKWNAIKCSTWNICHSKFQNENVGSSGHSIRAMNFVIARCLVQLNTSYYKMMRLYINMKLVLFVPGNHVHRLCLHAYTRYTIIVFMIMFMFCLCYKAATWRANKVVYQHSAI